MVLDALGIVENEQAVAWKIVKDCGWIVEIGEIERDIFKRAALTEQIKVVLPAFFGVVLQASCYQAASNFSRPRGRVLEGLRGRGQ